MFTAPELELLGPLAGQGDWQIGAADRAVGNEFGIDAICARILRARGFDDPEATRDQLSPRLAGLPRPQGMADYDQAIDLLVHAVEAGAVVGVFGDYDVDGVSSAAVMSAYLGELGVTVVTQVASRGAGYGFSPEAAASLADAGAGLVVTVDCGTSDLEALELLRQRGVSTIVVDHHQVPEERSPADALINPHRDDCGFTFKHLCSVGVAFYLCSGLRTKLVAQGKVSGRGPDPRRLLDLVALGTICDMVPLVGANRILVAQGLQALPQIRRPGVVELCRRARVDLRHGLDASHVAFQLGPRLNAPGRLGSAKASFDLLASQSEEGARPLGEAVERANRERREWQGRIVAEALAQVGGVEAARRRAGWVVADDAWLPGVVGIAAARLVREFDRPTLAIGVDPESGEARGSARSCRGIDVHAALGRCESLLRKFGGHRAAAGVSLAWERVPELVERFDAAVAEQCRAQGLEDHSAQVQQVDAELPPSLINFQTIASIRGLGPYGVGFPAPVFVARGLHVEDVRVFAGEHVELQLKSGGCRLEAVAFSVISPGDSARAASWVGRSVDAVYAPQINTFRGQRKIQLRLERFWPAE